MKHHELPSTFPLSTWETTKITLHLYLQIIGKIRLKLHPKLNHWWHVTFYVTPRGLTTGPMPYQNGLLAIDFDFLSHELIVHTNHGNKEIIALNNLPVAEFYQRVFALLDKFSINISINEKPFDPQRVKSDIPFKEDFTHASYDKKAIATYWQILTYFYPTFQTFAGQFNGKQTPIHLFWHTFDLALTRFSGRLAPEIPNMDPVTRQAYSHEVISFGFWAGDDNIPEPAFYSYTYPEPLGLNREPLMPKNASWQTANDSSLAILRYYDLVKLGQPRKAVLTFFESAFQAGSKCANWSTV